ncbi:MAG: hypothetical protein N2559_15140 [Anaerolineae bacterium]|nr:hypothetical protein [Anaerolineae bacterium]
MMRRVWVYVLAMLMLVACAPTEDGGRRLALSEAEGTKDGGRKTKDRRIAQALWLIDKLAHWLIDYWFLQRPVRSFETSQVLEC